LPLGRRLPSSKVAGRPRLDARLHDNGGGGKFDDIVITNHGPGDVFNLSVSVETKPGLSTHPAAQLPVPRLPHGKSVKAIYVHDFNGSASYFMVTVTGRTETGDEISDEIFVSEG
jgi:hypothetical protein